MFKCKLQKNVEGDLLAFEEEPEEVLAEIWYKVASYSDNNEEIMKAYRKSLHIIKVNTQTIIHSCFTTSVWGLPRRVKRCIDYLK